jgi:hypothetical protein
MVMCDSRLLSVPFHKFARVGASLRATVGQDFQGQQHILNATRSFDKDAGLYLVRSFWDDFPKSHPARASPLTLGF